MIYLPNNCRCSNLTVFPKNWDLKGASCDVDWYISYRFYDPTVLTPEGKIKPKLCIIKRMNAYRTVSERRDAVRTLIKNELNNLQNREYNPITGAMNGDIPNKPPALFSSAPVPIPAPSGGRDEVEYGAPLIQVIPGTSITVTVEDFEPSAPFIRGLWAGYTRLKYDKYVMTDIRSIIHGVEAASLSLNIAHLPVSAISRKHFILIFDACAALNSRFSIKRRNRYRDYLMSIFNELVAMEAATHNPLKEVPIALEKSEDSVPDDDDESGLLTEDERRRISEHLYANCYAFWRYIQLFYHSGARTTELLRLKESYIDLKKQRYRTLVKKRKVWTWVWRPIKDVAVDLWKEILQECKELHERMSSHGVDLFVFSEGLRPGTTSIRKDTIGRRWSRWVMKPPIVRGRKTNGLGINKKFNQLRHLSATELMDALTQDWAVIRKAEKEVAELTGHTDSTMLQKVYDKRNETRKADRIKSVKSKFA